jgi:hypothetical protein
MKKDFRHKPEVGETDFDTLTASKEILKQEGSRTSEVDEADLDTMTARDIVKCCGLR